ncbi:MAG: NUDIX domain-containing protein [Aureibaculum sp.]|nr:NUDIX domain-containing protein [Aureibaculum sp.]
MFTNKNNFFKFDDVDLQTFIIKLENEEINDLYLYDDNIQLLFEKFRNSFRVIEAAGGIVKNSKDELLFIFRNGLWDLPKGKIEKNESIKEAALREVEEECGIKQLKLDKLIDRTYHIYKINDLHILKITHWFLMHSDFQGEFFPQLEEGITRVQWVSRKNLTKVLVNTFANIKLLCLNL